VTARGLDQPTDQGRIWRVVPADRPLRARVDLTTADQAALVNHISGPSGHLRDHASRLLVERCRSLAPHPSGEDRRPDTTTVRALVELSRGVQVDPAVRHSAASTLMMLGAGDMDLIHALSLDRDARLRADAAIFAAGMLHGGQHVQACVATLERLAQDPARSVAIAALASLGEVQDDRDFIEAVGRLVATGGVLSDASRRAALASGIKGRSMLLLEWSLSLADGGDAGVRALAKECVGQVLAHGNERLNEALLALAARASSTQPQIASTMLDRVAAWTKPGTKDARVLRMHGQPVGWGELVAAGPRAVRAVAVLLDPQLSWPGRPGYFRPTVELSADQRGRLLYGNCVGCHQASGAGMPPVYPPLRDSPFVTGDPSRLIRILVHGLEGDLELDGVTYRGAMPAAPIQSDADLALLASWLRSQWGHASEPITPEFVSRVRAADATRTGPWTAQLLESATTVAPDR